MPSSAPDVQVDTGAAATLYVSAPASLLRGPAAIALLSYLDARGMELVCARSEDTAEVIARCDALLALVPEDSEIPEKTSRDLHIAAGLGRPSLTLSSSSRDSLDSFLDGLGRPARSKPYAFLAVRLHPDFLLIRNAIGDAVERTLGIPCVWFDDPRVITPELGVRERTELMIRHCALFIADLTYSPNNPDHDSPNTAHEIGMALAYGCPVLLSCQEPRRDLYFSAGDLHTIFWENEEHLHSEMTSCFRSRYSKLGRRLLNLELDPNSTGFSGAFPRYRFRMEAARRYIQPARRASALMPDPQSCLLAVRRHPEQWKAVWHPLGFIDIELYSNATDFLRLHIWSDLAGSYRGSGLSIHKHDWSMSSYVICGAIENRVYDISSGQPSTHRVYCIEYEGDANRLRATDRTVRCELKESRTTESRATYTLAANTFHDTARPARAVTATLVRGIRHPEIRNEVLGPLDARGLYETERVPCDAATLRKAIDLVLSSHS